MPMAQLDAACALVVIDLQKGIVGMLDANAGGGVVANAAKLARAFRARKLPVVLVNVAGRPPGRTDAGSPKLTPSPDWTGLLPELEPQPDDLRITKHCPGAFVGTSLHEQLQRRGVTQIVLAGVSTSVGVESTARSAFDHGYNVAFAVDAMADRDPTNHKHSIEQVFPRLGETAMTEQLLKLLR